MKDIFTLFYKRNTWGGTESVSGPGSSLHESRELINKLPLLLNLFEINSILDAPCGDFYWMKHVPLPAKMEYIGVDIVTELIEKNNLAFKNAHLQFIEKDITQDTLPTVDLILCRDALVHLPLDSVKASIRNFQQSNSKYILMTHFPTLEENVDITVGRWRPIHFGLPPFSFPEPMVSIKETTSIKTMSLWKLADLTV